MRILKNALWTPRTEVINRDRPATGAIQQQKQQSLTAFDALSELKISSFGSSCPTTNAWIDSRSSDDRLLSRSYKFQLVRGRCQKLLVSTPKMICLVDRENEVGFSGQISERGVDSGSPSDGPIERTSNSGLVSVLRDRAWCSLSLFLW